MVDAHSYTEVKDSGIDWIGYIPESWDIRTLYQLVTQVKCKNSDLQENNLLSLSYGKIKRKDIDSPEGLLPASFDGYNIIEAGDIVLRLTDLQNDHTSLRVGLATERGIITSAYTTLRPINAKHSKYIYYLLHAFDLKKGFYGMGSGVRQGLNYDEVKELRIVLPSESEQEAITAFLDEQCTQIDSIIEEAKVSIEEYKAWKASIIYEAVTKGLNPNVEMKDSGVHWIGKFPANWKLEKIKYNFRIINGCGFKVEFQGQVSGDYPFCKASDLSGSGKIINSAANYVTKELAIRERYNIVPVNSILFAKIGEALKKNHRKINSIECIVDNNCEALTQTKDNSIDYMYYQFLCIDMAWFDNSGTIPCINNQKLLDSFLVLPPRESQIEIASYLDNKCSEIDNIIDEKLKLIFDLESYKRSLIYETVTGKRRVV